MFIVTREDGRAWIELVGEDCDSGYQSPPVKLAVRSTKKGGLTPHLAACGRIVRLYGPSIRNSPYFAGNPAKHLKSGNDYSLLSFPLKSRKGQTIGLVKLQNKKDVDGKPNPRLRFTDADLILATLLSNRLVTVMEEQSLIAFLNTLVRDRPSAGSLPFFESQILAQALSLIGADSGSLALWDRARKRLIISATHGQTTLRMGQRVHRQSVMDTVWKSGESLLIPNVQAYRGAYWKVNAKSRSELAVLVTARDSTGHFEPIGVLNGESNSARAFDSQDKLF